MRTTKYFYNAETDRLVIVEVEGGEATNVLELTDPLTVEEETEQDEDEEETPETGAAFGRPEKPAKTEQPKKQRGGRKPANYDRDEVEQLINQGVKAGEIAAQTGAPIGSVYQIKSDMKKEGRLADEPAAPADDAEDDEPAAHEDPFVAKMIGYLREGRTEQEIYNFMHDALTDGQFRQKFEIAKRSK